MCVCVGGVSEEQGDSGLNSGLPSWRSEGQGMLREPSRCQGCPGKADSKAGSSTLSPGRS